MISSAQGEVYDLDRMFAKLNRRYFDGAIPKPTITWSQRRTQEHSRSSRPYLRQHHDQQDSRFERRSRMVCRVHPLSRDAAHQTSGTVDQRAALLPHERISARTSAGFRSTSRRRNGSSGSRACAGFRARGRRNSWNYFWLIDVNTTEVGGLLKKRRLVSDLIPEQAAFH